MICDHPRSKFSQSCRLGGITYRCRKCLTCGDTWWSFEAFYGRETPPNVKEFYAKKAAEEKAIGELKKAVSLNPSLWKRTP